MTLIKEYAFEPEALKTWEQFRYFFEKLGFSRGRLGVRIPAAWADKVLEGCNQEDKKKIEVRLATHGPNRLISALPLGNAKARSWWDQVRHCHRQRPLAGAIMASSRSLDPTDPPAALAQDVSEDFLPDETETEVMCTAKELAEVMEPLLRLSAKVIVVDRYFNPTKDKFVATLAEIMFLASRAKCEHIDVITEKKEDKRCGFDELSNRIRRCAQCFPRRRDIRYPRLPKVRILFVESVPAFHPRMRHHRLLLSEVGAIRIDAGFAAEGKKSRSDVVLIGETRHKELLETYSEPLLPIVDECSEARGVLHLR